jgi:hypothetical protein
MILILGTSFPAEVPADPVIVVANSIDGELNTEIVDFIRQEREVIFIEPKQFTEYTSSTYIVILGGHTAEGTGDIVKEILSDGEKESLTREETMLVKLNVWTTEQVVIVLAGPDREKTQNVCEHNTMAVVSLFAGIEYIKTMVKNSIAFLYGFPVDSTDSIGPYAPSPLSGDTLSHMYTLEEESWFFWVDDFPYAKYAHPTRFIFFGIQTKSTTIYQEAWWPVLNGRPLWISSDYWDSTNWVVNGVTTNTHQSVLHSQIVQSTKLTNSLGKDNVIKQDRALIINGGFAAHPFCTELHTDETEMKTALTTIGMNAESVHTIKEIKYVLTRWSQEMLPHETLIVYITAHGGRGYFVIKDEIFQIHELVTLLDDFDQEVHIHIIIDSSYSGSLIDPLKVLADSVMVSTGETTPAYSDWDPEHDVNPDDTGSEFTSGLALCIKELARNTSKIEFWKNQAFARGESWYIYVLTEAFGTNKELDVCAHTGLTHPRIWKRTENILEEGQQREGEGEGEGEGGGGCPCGS